MKILVLGGGGREHAIAWRCAEEGHKVYACPGNPGIATFAECIPVDAQTPEHFLQVANLLGVDLTIVGPEAPLVAGVADHFEAAGLKIFGPRQAAAQLEGSKAFSKEFMARHGIPTARFMVFEEVEAAKAALCRFEYPVVLKADGLAAGKGVVIAKTKVEAERALEQMFDGSLVGAAGSRVVIEDFWRGEEVSFIAICDHDDAVVFPPTQDHKAIFDNDEGPNTGGMGTYCDDRILTPEQKQQLAEEVVLKTIRGMAAEGMPFRGFLFAGLMMTEEGAKVLEFNVRLGDPETQSILTRVEGGFGEAVYLATTGRLKEAKLRVADGVSCCVVLAASGYPGTPKSGDVIRGIGAAEEKGVRVFHAGTKQRGEEVVTSGGRVLGVTAKGADLREAIAKAYEGVREIGFEGMQYRKDIGAKGLKRYTGKQVGT